MVFVFDSNTSRDASNKIPPRPFCFVSVYGAQLTKNDWNFSGRSETSRRTITASVTRSGFNKMTSNSRTGYHLAVGVDLPFGIGEDTHSLSFLLAGVCGTSPMVRSSHEAETIRRETPLPHFLGDHRHAECELAELTVLETQALLAQVTQSSAAMNEFEAIIT